MHSQTKWGSGWLCTLHQPSTSVTDDMMACGTPAAAAWRLSSAAASTAAVAPAAAPAAGSESTESCSMPPYSARDSPAGALPLPLPAAAARPAKPPSTPVGVDCPLTLGAESGAEVVMEREARESGREPHAEEASQKASASAGSGR